MKLNRRKIKIVIGGPCPSTTDDRGDEAVFYNFCVGIRKFFDCEITALVRHPNKKFEQLFDVKTIKNFDHDSHEESEGRFFLGFNPGDSPGNLKTIKKTIEACDLVVIGGSCFEENSPDTFLRGQGFYGAMLAMLATFFAKPYAVYGMMQPLIKKDTTRQLAKFVCEGAQVVTLKEQYSREQLLNANISDQNMHVLVDPALGVQPIFDLEKGLNILEQEDINVTKKPIVGILFRSFYWLWNEIEFKNYRDKLAEFCDQIIEKYDVQLLFIPLQCYTKGNPYIDDRFTARQVCNSIQNKSVVFTIKGNYALPETLSLFQLLDLVITNRRHGTNFAALHHVPFMTLYTHENKWKIYPLLKSLEMSDYAIDFENFNINHLIESFDKIWKSKTKLSKKLASQVIKLQEKAALHTELIAKNILKKVNRG